LRLIRFGPAGKERLGLLFEDNERRALSSDCDELDTPLRLSALLSRIAAMSPKELDALLPVTAEERWAAAIPRPGKIVGHRS
jgi:predicted ATPase